MESARDRHRYRQRERERGQAGRVWQVRKRWWEDRGGMCHLRAKHLEWRKRQAQVEDGGEKEGTQRETKRRKGRQSAQDRDLEQMTDSGSSRERIEEKGSEKKKVQAAHSLPTVLH